MTSLFKRSAAAVFIRGASDEGKGEAGGAVSSQTAGCGPRAAPEEMPREGRMPTARKHSADVRCRQTETFGFASKNLFHKFFTRMIKELHESKKSI
jgi:hypothetical protein